MLTNLHLLQTKTANNLVMHIGTLMIFGGILEGVWPNNNQKNFDYATSDARVKMV